jgi:hypothetical protein
VAQAVRVRVPPSAHFPKVTGFEVQGLRLCSIASRGIDAENVWTHSSAVICKMCAVCLSGSPIPFSSIAVLPIVARVLYVQGDPMKLYHFPGRETGWRKMLLHSIIQERHWHQ